MTKSRWAARCPAETPRGAMRTELGRNAVLGCAVALVAATLLPYLQVLGHGFINYDDTLYVTQNYRVQSGLSLAGIRWAFRTFYAANWHPLTWLSHMLDCTLYGMAPVGHHATSLLLHAANTALVFLVFRRGTGAFWRSALVAALFGLHPLHVESVAWIAERKDVLSTFFLLAAIYSYFRYASKPGVLSYLAVVVFFILGIMAKAMVVTLPFLLLLLDYWPLGRVRAGNVPSRVRRWVTLLVEKAPLILLAALCAGITILAQGKSGAVKTLDTFTFDVRFANALVSYGGYLGKTLWPARLAAYYPHPGATISLGLAASAALFLVGITAAALATAHRYPWLIVGWLWYLGALLPVVGIVQVGDQAVADRYTYVPLIGIFVLLVWSIPERWLGLPRRRAMVTGGALAWLVLLTACTWVQASRWRDSETLFAHTLKVTRGNAVAHCGLGDAYLQQGRLDEAIRQFRYALDIKPLYSDAHNNLALALARQGDLTGAVRHYREALRMEPNQALWHCNLAAVLNKQGNAEESRAQYEQALALDADLPEAHNGLGSLLLRVGQVDAATAHFRQTLAVSPNDAVAWNGLGTILFREGENGEALRHFIKAVEFDPQSAQAHANLAVVYARDGNAARAIEHMSAAVRLEPTNVQNRFRLGQLQLRHGDPSEAVAHIAAYVQTDPEDVAARYDLALAMSLSGRDEAARVFEEVLRLDPSHGDAWYNLGILCARQGRLEEAQRHLEKAVETAPDNAQAAEALSQVQRDLAQRQEPSPTED